MDEHDERALVRRYIQGGDRRAFEALFREYAPRLHRYFRHHVRDERACEDLVQQTFFHVHRARRDFDLSRPFRPWVFTIAANLRREIARRARRKPEDLVDPLDMPLGSADPQTSTPSDRAVRRALDALPESQREVIVLHWFEGLSFREISGVVGASLSAVKVRAHRGYARLRVVLGGVA